MHVRSSLPAIAALLLGFGEAHAGRPLATDDTGTAPASTCQVEAWAEHARDARALVLAPACGIADGLEIDAEFTRPQPRDEIRAAAGLALKWAPADWSLTLPVGALSFGLKASVAHQQVAAPGGWRHTESALIGLATLVPAEGWALHLNLGPTHEHTSGRIGTLLNLALTNSPAAEWLLFVEAQANDRPGVFGHTVRTIGGRRWLIAEKFGLDLTASRQTGSGTTQWSFGLGWYGLNL